jgi:hypothetical protein
MTLRELLTQRIFAAGCFVISLGLLWATFANVFGERDKVNLESVNASIKVEERLLADTNKALAETRRSMNETEHALWLLH